MGVNKVQTAVLLLLLNWRGLRQAGGGRAAGMVSQGARAEATVRFDQAGQRRRAASATTSSSKVQPGGNALGRSRVRRAATACSCRCGAEKQSASSSQACTAVCSARQAHSRGSPGVRQQPLAGAGGGSGGGARAQVGGSRCALVSAAPNGVPPRLNTLTRWAERWPRAQARAASPQGLLRKAVGRPRPQCSLPRPFTFALVKWKVGETNALWHAAAAQQGATACRRTSPHSRLNTTGNAYRWSARGGDPPDKGRIFGERRRWVAAPSRGSGVGRGQHAKGWAGFREKEGGRVCENS